MELPKRKHIRLQEYDYSQRGAYFVTICTKNRRRILSKIEMPVGPDALIGPQVRLTEVGQVADQCIKSTENAYPGVKVEKYVVMPNHIHLLLTLTGNGPMGASGPTLSRIVKGLKALVTRRVGYPVWQDNYHEHIIRDDNDFLKHWTYIDQNPSRWEDDEYFTEQEQGDHL